MFHTKKQSIRGSLFLFKEEASLKHLVDKKKKQKKKTSTEAQCDETLQQTWKKAHTAPSISKKEELWETLALWIKNLSATEHNIETNKSKGHPEKMQFFISCGY